MSVVLQNDVPVRCTSVCLIVYRRRYVLCKLAFGGIRVVYGLLTSGFGRKFERGNRGWVSIIVDGACIKAGD